jgi:hypothetical protein
VLRGQLLLVVLLAALCLHINFLPFKSGKNNQAESISLALLCGKACGALVESAYCQCWLFSLPDMKQRTKCPHTLQ